MHKKIIAIMLVTLMAVSGMTLIVNAKTVKVTAPKIKSVTALDTNTFKIKWTKSNNAKGYMLYCKRSGASYKKLATLSKKTTSYVHKNLTNGKKYFYKVKAFRKTSGKYKYSKYSNKMALKCTNYLVNIYTPYACEGYETYKDGKSFKMGGDSYTNGFTICGGDYAIFNLKGKYKYIEFTVSNSDENPNNNATVSILSDDYCVGTCDVKANALPKKVKFNIENANKLEIKNLGDWWNYPDVGFANVKLYR